MTYYDDIYEMAVDNHYLVTTSMAKEAGIPPVELAKLAHRGKLENLARGLYRLARYVPEESDEYAVAVARVGEDAYLFGESVIALLGLAPTNPARIWVASPRRVRLKNSPANLKIVPASGNDRTTAYKGVRCQTVAEAIHACAKTMMPERLEQAAKSARTQGYLTSTEMDKLEKEGIFQ